MKHLILSLFSSLLFFSSLAQISGSTNICVGFPSALSDPTPGGTWSSTNTSIATIDAGGYVYGIYNGTVTIWYTPSCCIGSSSISVTVSNAGPIAGTNAMCAGSSTTLSDFAGSGSWSSSNTSIATISSFGSGTPSIYAVSAGTVTISFTLSTGCSAIKNITVTNCGSLPAIVGSNTVCIASTTQLSDATAGGTWTSDNTSVASVSSTGLVFGISAGYANIFYSASGSVTGHTINVSNCGPLAIIGYDTVCLGTPTPLSDASPGGSWSSGTTSIATVSATGIVTGVTAGVVAISYTVSGWGTTTTTMHVLTSVQCAGITNPITGNDTVCAGATMNLSDAVAGGTWTSSNVSIATVDNTLGIVYGVSAGTATITYAGSSIVALKNIVVSSPGTIVGASSVVCTGANLELSDFTASSGGVWTSSNSTVATITYSGADASVHGATPGNTTVTFTTFTGCSTTYLVTVSSSVTAGTIYGTATVYAGGDTAQLHVTGPGGTWSSSNTAVATIDPYSGVYTGVSAGFSVITYTLTGCSGTSYATYTVTVNPMNGISGHVYFSSTPASGNVKVWLITYNPVTLDLEAIDSNLISGSGSTGIYYQFPGIATDSYRVKAAVLYTYSVSTTGNVPTYHTSSSYWSTANVIYHTSGTADVNEDINMLTGTVTSGPGFIGGNVSTGANKGTSTGIPVTGLNVYLFSSSPAALMQLTTTDASGNYSFSNLPVGTYYVFPDSLNYLTTPYTGINITTGSPSMSAADFIQHTLSKTITPVTTGIKELTTSAVYIYPNPTTDELTIKTGDAGAYNTCTITNNIGQVMLQQPLNSTLTKVNVKALPQGLYYITVRGNGGVQVQKFVKM